jgi:hypothetical protein
VSPRHVLCIIAIASQRLCRELREDGGTRPGEGHATVQSDRWRQTKLPSWCEIREPLSCIRGPRRDYLHNFYVLRLLATAGLAYPKPPKIRPESENELRLELHDTQMRPVLILQSQPDLFNCPETGSACLFACTSANLWL